MKHPCLSLLALSNFYPLRFSWHLYHSLPVGYIPLLQRPTVAQLAFASPAAGLSKRDPEWCRHTLPNTHCVTVSVCVSVYTCWCKDNGFQTKSWHCNTGLVLRFADWGQVSWDRSLLSAWISWGPPVTVGTQAAWFGHVLMLFDLEVWKFQEVFVSSYLFLSILAVHVISYTFIYYIYLYHIYILYIIYIIYMYIMVRCIEVPLFSLHFRFGRLTCQSM